MESVVSSINGVLWDSVLVYLLVCAGFWFTFRLKFNQFFHFGHMFKLLLKSGNEDAKGISSFQALMTSLAARVGTGNLAGVAVAITLGGPGAVFWMWVIALLGMATAFAESTLGQAYKVKDANGEYRGGPAYYIQKGLGNKALAMAFSICLFFGYGFVFSTVQANTIADALNNAYGIEQLYVGLVIAFVAGFIVLGGVRSIAHFSEYAVPIMGVVYIFLALFIVIVNLPMLPDVLWLIISSAFGLQEAAGGAIGAALINGIKRGLYSNEAGSGSVPHAAACASPNPRHPVTQGYIQMLGVFIDTMVICSCSAFIVLLAGIDTDSGMAGIRLIQEAVTFHVGDWGTDFIAFAILLFSFTSVVANYAYGENNLHLFKLDGKKGRYTFTAGYLAMIVWGSAASIPVVWALADMALGLMTLINVTALILFTPTIVKLAKDYHQALKENRTPEFDGKDKSLYQGELEPDVWDESTSDSKS
jgi:AGCS family alanine or glycine:cation symporter